MAEPTVTTSPASLLTIFGATGDLAQRMLLPSLYSLQAENLLPPQMRILGTARSELDRESFANLVSAAIGERIPSTERNDAALRGLLARLDYGAASVDGAMVDEPVRIRARAILARLAVPQAGTTASTSSEMRQP